MSRNTEPIFTVTGDVATLAFPTDDYALDFRDLSVGKYGGFYAEITARYGTQVLHIARFDLLNQRERELFHQRCVSMNGSMAIDWQARLLTALPSLRELTTRADHPSTDTATPWPPRQDLPSLLPDAPSLPAAMLPDALRPWMEDIAERMQVPLEYVAIPALVALGAVVGRQIGIHPKQHDEWLVIANLWGAIVGRSGLMKSPTLAQALLPLDRLAAGAIDAYEAREERNKTTRDSLDAQIAGVKEALKKAAKDATATAVQTHAGRLATLQAERDELTNSVRRFKTNDATIQKLGELLRDNPNGLLFFRDELSGWLSSLSQEGREGDREFFLETWNGDGTYTFDRIGRGMIPRQGPLPLNCRRHSARKNGQICL